MSSHHRLEGASETGVTHQPYLDIINCVPDAVYWTDVNCNLVGCNNSFINLMGLKNSHHLKETPYELMINQAHWPKARVEALKLDDMNVIFAASPRCNIEEKAIIDGKNHTLYFKSNRMPMYDNKKRIVGLTVVLTDITELKKIQERMNKEAKQMTSSSSEEVPTHRLPKVLMIEDNLIAQNVERALLTALNCHVDIADTGDKALQLFNPGKYDLVFMDIGLEDTSGYVVAKQLRSKEKDTEYHVPIIALTGYEADVVKYDCEQYFMEGAITKPLTSEQAEQIIKHYVYHMEVDIPGLKSIE
jgi:CheY-like chemotaxis protein